MAKKKCDCDEMSQEEFDEEQAKAGVRPLESPDKQEFRINITLNMPPVYPPTHSKDIVDTINNNGIGISQDKDHW